MEGHEMIFQEEITRYINFDIESRINNYNGNAAICLWI